MIMGECDSCGRLYTDNDTICSGCGHPIRRKESIQTNAFNSLPFISSGYTTTYEECLREEANRQALKNHELDR